MNTKGPDQNDHLSQDPEVLGRDTTPTIIIIFGAGGDLTWRKLVPALYNLYLDQWLPDQFVIIGVDRQDMNDHAFGQRLRDGVNRFSRQGRVDEARWASFAAHLSYSSAELNADQTFTELAELISSKSEAWNQKPNQVFYLAIPPSLLETVVQGLEMAGLTMDREHVRLVVEKPFGYDLNSAQALNQRLIKVFDESQIYRIDHYLGKETVQNILAFRFANALFEPIWDQRYIEQVQITVSEKVGVAHRGGYYDQAGALRDMIQNHLLQILCLMAMEPPISFAADEIRSKKVDVLRAIRPFSPAEVRQLAARGQYQAGKIDDESVPAYLDEPEVAPHSNTETFAALKLLIDNWRWQGVPFYLRTGKRLSRKVSTAIIQFRPVPHRAFPDTTVPNWRPNHLTVRIQPNEGIDIDIQAKQPGLPFCLSRVNMHFRYEEAFRDNPLPDAYETLLLDVMQGDPTLFMRADQIEAAWRVIMPVLERWADSLDDLSPYPAGTWGPKTANELVARDRYTWIKTD